eukprot:TCONS_00007497-protein
MFIFILHAFIIVTSQTKWTWTTSITVNDDDVIKTLNRDISKNKNDAAIRNNINVRDFEILRTDQFIHVKNGVTTRQVTFDFHNRQFVLELRQNSDILTDDFDIRHHATIDRRELYTGYVKGEFTSDVHVAIDNNDVITGVVYTDAITLRIEPLRGYATNARKREMIIYAHSNDVTRFSGKKIGDDDFALMLGKGLKEEGRLKNARKTEQITRKAEENARKTGENTYEFLQDISQKPLFRTRRSNTNKCDFPKKTLCPMYVVADHRFFKYVGGSEKKNTIYHMLQAIRFADKVFKETTWNDGVTCNIGLTVGDFYVLEKPGNFSFNKPADDNKPEAYQNILQDFSREKSLLPGWKSSYCLAHLFTYRDFKDDVVGYAYIGNEDTSPGRYNHGSHAKSYGICGQQNVAFSSYFNSARNTGLLTLEANLVTTHEIAHNFGARHDKKKDPTCYLGRESDTGNFLMFDLMVTGRKRNNAKLSPCSIASISRVIKRKSERCFIQQNDTLCTNGVLDPGEECDPGLFGNDDPCCDRNCNLKPGAQCSDLNHVCCTECQFASGKLCKERSDADCLEASYCDGTSAGCVNITRDPITDNTTCDYGKGNCQKEGCVSICNQRGKEECNCADAGIDACKICCRDKQTGLCSQVLDSEHVWDGVPCEVNNKIGTCRAGICVKVKRRVDDEFDALLKDFSFNNLRLFMMKNIVGTILVISILFWAPVACVVHWLDKKQDEEEKFNLNWTLPSNSELVLSRGARKKRLGLLFRRQAASAKRVKGGQFHISR